MRISVSVGGVDGETDIGIDTPSAQAARAFLLAHDHEGSSLSIHVDSDDPEDVYQLIDALIDIQRNQHRLAQQQHED